MSQPLDQPTPSKATPSANSSKAAQKPLSFGLKTDLPSATGDLLQPRVANSGRQVRTFRPERGDCPDDPDEFEHHADPDRSDRGREQEDAAVDRFEQSHHTEQHAEH